MPTVIYHMLKDGVEHNDLGASHFDRRPAVIKANRWLLNSPSLASALNFNR